MKRLREGFTFTQDQSIGMTCRVENNEVVLIPYIRETGQLLFRWMAEYEIK
jgi:hypothetical protein